MRNCSGSAVACVNWNFELGAIPVLMKQGWKKDSLKAGDTVTVDGSRAMLPDGRRLFGGSSGDPSTPQ